MISPEIFMYLRAGIICTALILASYFDVKSLRLDNRFVVAFASICFASVCFEHIISDIPLVRTLTFRIVTAVAVFLICYFSTCFGLLKFGGADAKMISLLAIILPFVDFIMMIGAASVALILIFVVLDAAPVWTLPLKKKLEAGLPLMVIILWGYVSVVAFDIVSVGVF